MLQNSMFSAYSYECFLKRSTMASYATPFNSSHNSFSYSSGLEFTPYRPPVTSDNSSNSDATAKAENQQHSTVNGTQDIMSNGNMIRSSEKMYGNQRPNMNGLSGTIDNSTRGA